MKILLDPDIRAKIGNRKLHLTQKGYVYVCYERKKITLQKFVMGSPPMGMEIDHINGNKLDNRKKNLRFLTHADNLRNRKSYSISGFKGVYFENKRNIKKWRADIKVRGVRYSVGYHLTPLDAKTAIERFICEMGVAI